MCAGLYCVSIEQCWFGGIIAHHWSAEMLVGKGCYHASTWCALDESLHYEVRFVYLFYSSCIFANGSTDGRQSNRTTLELIDDGEENLVVYLVKTILVDV